MVVSIVKSDGNAGGRKVITKADRNSEALQREDGMLNFVPPMITSRAMKTFINPIEDVMS